MMSSLDGRIIVQRWGQNPPGRADYETTANTYDAQAWLCGRVTMEKDFTEGRPPVLKPVTAPLDRRDFVAEHGAESFAIAVDAHGKLGWDAASIDDDHIIEVLTEQVPDAYLVGLRELGISYIFGGRTELNFAVVLEKLGRLFPIQTILLEGGGHLNGSLLKAGLVDEISQLILPLVDGASNSAVSFEQGPNPGPARHLKLLALEQRPHDVLWLRYEVGKEVKE